MYEFRRRKSADGSAVFAHPHFTRDGARLARVVRKKRASSSSWEDVDAEASHYLRRMWPERLNVASTGVTDRARRRVDQRRRRTRGSGDPAAVPRRREPSDRTTFATTQPQTTAVVGAASKCVFVILLHRCAIAGAGRRVG